MSYQRHGFQILPQLLNHAEIEQLRGFILPIYQQWVAQNQHLAGFDQLVNMHSLTHPQYFVGQPEQRATFFNQLANPKLVKSLQDIFGQDLYFHNTQLFFNPRNTQKTNYWHRDLQYSSVPDAMQQHMHHQLTNLHVRIPLVDEIGMELIAHSHHQWDTELEKKVRFALDGHQQHHDLPNSQLIELKHGDVLVFNAQMIHRGRYDFNAERLALDICIAKPHHLLNDFIDATIQPTLEELGQIAHADWYQHAAKLIYK